MILPGSNDAEEDATVMPFNQTGSGPPNHLCDDHNFLRVTTHSLSYTSIVERSHSNLTIPSGALSLEMLLSCRDDVNKSYLHYPNYFLTIQLT